MAVLVVRKRTSRDTRRRVAIVLVLVMAPRRLPEKAMNHQPSLEERSLSLQNRDRTFSQKCCEIKSLIQRLRFIKHKARWSATFLPGIIKIGQEDFDVILDCTK